MTDYTLSKQGAAELASYEGLALKPYLDSGGVKTVGIGSTVSDIPDLGSWPWDKELSVKEAFELYMRGLTKYVNAVNKALLVEIPQHKFDALVSICYNIGTEGMRKSTFMARVNNNESDARVTSAMERWNKDNGRVVQGLVNRRAKESQLYITGRYMSGGLVPLISVNAAHKPSYKKTINILEYL